MTYDKSTLTVEPTSRDRVLTPAFLLVAAATLFAFLSIGVVLPGRCPAHKAQSLRVKRRGDLSVVL
jgi:hypothetical protein